MKILAFLITALVNTGVGAGFSFAGIFAAIFLIEALR